MPDHTFTVDLNCEAPNLFEVALDDDDQLNIGRPAPFGAVALFPNGDVYVWKAPADDEPVKVFAGVAPRDVADAPPEPRRRIPVRTVGQLRRLMEQLPDDTPIGLRVTGLVGAGDEDVFTGGLRFARISDAPHYSPHQFTLHLAAEGAM